MTNKATKYGLMTIAAVLLVAMAFAGAASADTRVIDNLDDYLENFSTSLTINEDTTYYFMDGDGWMIPSLHNGSDVLTFDYNVTLDFTNFTGNNFVGIPSVIEGDKQGALFGSISGKAVDIVGLNLTSVKVICIGSNCGGIIGYSDNAVLNFTNCHLLNCSLKQESTGKREFGGVIGSLYSTKANIYNCTARECEFISAGTRVGGIVGCGKGAFVMCNVTKCKISGSSYVGAICGHAKYVFFRDCNTEYCVVTGESNYIGNMIGHFGDVYDGSSPIMKNCNARNGLVYSTNEASTAESVAGLIGSIGSSVGKKGIEGCTVMNCTTVATGAHFVGGLIGKSNGFVNITDCEVIDCNKISGEYGVGGLIGLILATNGLNATNCVVTNMKIIGTNLSSGQMMGGFVGCSINDESNLNNNTLENVVIEATNENGVQYAYLFDVSKYPINSTNGIAKLAQVNLANDNKIINCYVLDGYYGKENTELDGFTGLTTEFSINVSNPKVTSIGANTFKDVKLTGLSNIGSVTEIKENAFNGTNLTGGFYLPDAIFGSNVFNGTKLQAIYGDITSVALPDSVTKIDITADGQLTDILPGSFDLKADNVFEDVTLGSEPAKYFKNLSSATTAYLFASESWVAGNTYLALATAGTEITLNPVEGSGSAPESVVALEGNKKLSADITAPVKAGYTFGGWYDEITGGILVINTTGKLNVSAAGYTDADGKWINPASALSLYANWTVNQTTKVAESNVSIFGNDNYTAVRDSSVISILLESVNNVTDTVTFTADNTTVNSVLPSLSGMNAPITVSIFEINATNDGSGTNSAFYVNVTFSDIANKDNVKFFHFSTENNAWDSTPLTSSIVDVYTSENKVLYKVETDNFSPFGVGIYTAIPQPTYSPSSSHSTGSTQILSEGQVAPTAYATATPTVAPTAKPTQAPATPTVIATEKPTTQATQQSPAPFIGLLAGLGAAAVLLRLRK